MQQTINPAALLGTSIRRHIHRLEHKELEFVMYPSGSRYDKLYGHVDSMKPALIADLHALQLTNRPTGNRFFSFDNLSYASMLEVAKVLATHGYQVNHPLMDAQVASMLAGFVTPEHKQAYEEYVAGADSVLKQIHELKLPEFAKAKAIRSVTGPRRARALSYQAKGVHIWPDEFDARYIRVACFSLSEASQRAVRDVAYDFYGALGLRTVFTVS